MKSLKAGRYRIVVRDRSHLHNFHLTGPGVNKKTTVAFHGNEDVDGHSPEGRDLPLRLRPAQGPDEGQLPRHLAGGAAGRRHQAGPRPARGADVRLAVELGVELGAEQHGHAE